MREQNVVVFIDEGWNKSTLIGWRAEGADWLKSGARWLADATGVKTKNWWAGK